MIVPAAVPREIVQRLNREINDALQLPDVREKAAAAGLVPVGGSAEDFDALIKAEMDRWAQIIRTRGIKAQ
jgi:tripartite-type tricarboxylate transporter receptor subunit TctC